MGIAFRSPVTRELRPYRGANVPRPPDAGDAFYVTSPFGPRGNDFHGGLDIGNGRTGYPIVATAAGTVLAVGFLGMPWSQPTTRWPTGNFGGLMIVLEHLPGLVSIYAHCGAIGVERGQRVSAGQTIGAIGDTGSAAGQAHLHFGIQARGIELPALLSRHVTPYGIGLDVDPWPLITGVMTVPEGFTDVPDDSPFAADIAFVAEARIMRGTGDGKFSPKAVVTREQLAATLHRLAQYVQRLDVDG